MTILFNKYSTQSLQLSGHEISKLITVVTAMAKKMGLEEASDNEIAELKKDVHAEKVIDVIEKLEQKNSR